MDVGSLSVSGAEAVEGLSLPPAREHLSGERLVQLEEVDVREAPVELAEQLGRGRGPSLDHEADGLGDHRRPVAALDLDRDERGELGAGGLAVE